MRCRQDLQCSQFRRPGLSGEELAFECLPQTVYRSGSVGLCCHARFQDRCAQALRQCQAQIADEGQRCQVSHAQVPVACCPQVCEAQAQAADEVQLHVAHRLAIVSCEGRSFLTNPASLHDVKRDLESIAEPPRPVGAGQALPAASSQRMCFHAFSRQRQGQPWKFKMTENHIAACCWHTLFISGAWSAMTVVRLLASVLMDALCSIAGKSTRYTNTSSLIQVPMSVLFQAYVGVPAAPSSQKFVDASGRPLKSQGMRVAEVQVGAWKFRAKFLVGGVTCPLLSLGKLYRAGFCVVPSSDSPQGFVLTNGEISEPVRLKRQSLCTKGHARVLNEHPQDDAARAIGNVTLQGPLLLLDASGWQCVGSRCYALLIFGLNFVDTTLVPLSELLWYRTTLVRRGGEWTLLQFAEDVASIPDRSIPFEHRVRWERLSNQLISAPFALLSASLSSPTPQLR